MLKYPNFFKSFSLMTASIEIHSHTLLNKAVKFFLLNSKGFVCLHRRKICVRAWVSLVC